MGRGDKRTFKGKISKRSFGKTRRPIQKRRKAVSAKVKAKK